MNFLNIRKANQVTQLIISLTLVAIVGASCIFLKQLIDYKSVALILLMTVSVIAMLFDFLPVLLSAVLSAFIWNFFFIQPVFTFTIANADDFLMFIMYFFIALLSAVLTYKIRVEEKKVRDREENENAIRLYNTLLNSLSHELRTPISTIMGAVDTLKENEKKISSENTKELLSQIDHAGMRLNQQVENLLNMSRLESGILKTHLDWCDINELIFSIIQRISNEKGKHIIQFDSNENLPLFRLDAGMMEQSLYNIIHNAIQHTPENSTIQINALFVEGNCKIIISDNGDGFPETEIQNVFNKFYRLSNSKTGGSGLGLSIAKGFIEAHQGKILLENNPTGGSKFTITIKAETSFINDIINE